MKTISVSTELTSGNYFVISIYDGTKKAKIIRLDRKGAIEVAQQLLEGLKETKKVYNKKVRNNEL